MKKLLMLLSMALILSGCSAKTEPSKTDTTATKVVQQASKVTKGVTIFTNTDKEWDESGIEVLQDISISNLTKDQFDLSLSLLEGKTLGGRTQLDQLHMQWNADFTKASGIFTKDKIVEGEYAYDGYYGSGQNDYDVSTGESKLRLELIPNAKDTIIRIIKIYGKEETQINEWKLISQPVMYAALDPLMKESAVFTGTIGSYPVSMFLDLKSATTSESQLGYYFYDKHADDYHKDALTLYGKIDDGQLIITEKDGNGKKTGTLKLHAENNMLTGEFVGKNKLTIKLQKYEPQSSNEMGTYLSKEYRNEDGSGSIGVMGLQPFENHIAYYRTSLGWSEQGPSNARPETLYFGSAKKNENGVTHLVLDSYFNGSLMCSTTDGQCDLDIDQNGNPFILSDLFKSAEKLDVPMNLDVTYFPSFVFLDSDYNREIFKKK